MLFYTYLHRRQSDNSPFYVGKGAGNRAHRTNHRNPHWHRTVKKYGLVVEIVAKWNTEHEALEHEKFLIHCFRDMGHRLVNLSNGGEGQSGWVPSEETRKRISLAKTGKPSPKRGIPLSESARLKMADTKRGQKLTDAHKAKISASSKGRPKTEEHKRKISEGNKGRVVSDETKRKISEAHKRRHQLTN